MRKLFQKGSLSLYGSVALLISALIVFVVIGAGIKGALYGLGILLLVGTFIYLLSKLPDLLARGLVTGIAVIFFSYIVQSWLFTLLFIVFAIADLLIGTYYKESWMAKFTSFSFFAMMAIGSVWASAYEPTIEQQVLLEAAEEMQMEDGVDNVNINVPGFSVDCYITLEADVPDAERQQLGEMCGKSVSDKVNPKRDISGKSNESIGYLYDYYSLFIHVLIKGEGEALQGVKHMSDEHVTWYDDTDENGVPE